MVKIDTPPPKKERVNTLFYTLPGDTKLLRLFERDSGRPFTTLFRYFGPLHRFDHQKPGSSPNYLPSQNKDRGVLYSAKELKTCIVEVFGEDMEVRRNYDIVTITTDKELKLLDLRGDGAIRAGAVGASANADTQYTQDWARYFYDDPDGYYPGICGIIWASAYNQGENIVFWERAEPHIHVDSKEDIMVREKEVLLICQSLNYICFS
ncbi:MAG: RES domain-containing protein [Desulforhopalus sp.]|jgi:putative intracellular protease/amidase|nr:RES domain-containing protein [Desulforhopalus sp.]